jgi:hypothetical protein
VNDRAVAAAASDYLELSASPPPEPLLVAPPPREQIDTRGRALSGASVHNASPRGITPNTATQARGKQSIDLERRPSLSYGHHRQTSIVHGIQHSRDPSLLATASSPLSPQKIVVPSGLHKGSGKEGTSMAQVNNHVSSGMAEQMYDISLTQRRVPERALNGNGKHIAERPASPLQLATIQHELSTVGEYAVRHLFTSFITEADRRIERCLFDAGHAEIPIEPICGPGADPAFDQLIRSLGHINRLHPGRLIASVIDWRKEKTKHAQYLFNQLQTMQAWTQSRPDANGIHRGTAVTPPSTTDIILVQQQQAHAEQRSRVSIYIICRVFIEVIEQTTLAALKGPDGTMSDARRLEEVIYGRLNNVEPDSVSYYPVIRANWAIRGQVLGVMSTFRFDEIADRFLRDLQIAHKSLSIKGMANNSFAKKTALLVQSMRWLRVPYQFESAFERACDVLQLLSKFFTEVHGRIMKHAYAELFESLVLPIAATATNQLNLLKWKDTLASLQPKISQMLSKTEHWPYVFPLQAVLLCASPLDTFASQWLSLATSFQSKAKERSARSHALKAICRLVWRYLYRCNEPQNVIIKKLDEIVKLIFGSGKRFLISTDPAIADPLIQLIRIIGYKQQDFCFRAIIFPLMNAELFSGSTDKELKIENLEPDKTVIAIRAFLVLMADLEKGEAPSFPVRFECDAFMDPTSRAPPAHRRTRSQGFVLSAGRTERESRPMMTNKLNETTKEYYVKFCKILGQLTIICDNTFGGQAVLDEKFASHAPKTPMADAFNFGRKDELMNPNDARQQYYDLLHVAVEALPRCLSPHLPINPLVNLLCTGTAHVQSHIASSSAQSLKSIARQSHAQQVTIGFARFIFNFDDRYATVSDGSLLGPGHIESTLKLYVELLQIWIDDIQKRTQKAMAEPGEGQEQGVKQLSLDLSGMLAHVDEVESHGLFFLCSPSQAVRAVAVTVLRLITKFDTALGEPCVRVISILEGSADKVIDVEDERLTLAERSRLIKGLRKSNPSSILIELCSSEVPHDATLWFKIFPSLVRLSAEVCLQAVALTRELVCQRLTHSSKIIALIADGQKPANFALQDAINSNRPFSRLPSSSSEIVVEQWKIHLIFACTTLTNIRPTAAQGTGQSSQHIRKSSRSSANSSEKMSTAGELFSSVVRFLPVPDASVRAAAVAGLGATNATLLHILIETLRPSISSCNNDAKERIATHNRSASNPRSRRRDFLRTELTHLLSLICPSLQSSKVSGESSIIDTISDYIIQSRLFLSDAHIQDDLEYQRLRKHFCALVENFYTIVHKRKDESKGMSFQSRQASFGLMEHWCGLMADQSHLRRQQENLRRSILDIEGDQTTRVIMTSAMEKERVELMYAALSAMASLCAGPLSFVTGKGVITQFDVNRMLTWIRATFESPSDRVHAIGRRALQNLIVSSPDKPVFMENAICMSYLAESPKARTGYFEVVYEVLSKTSSIKVPFWRMISITLYMLGTEDSTVRTRSAKLLRLLEEREGKSSKLQELDISVSDRTTTVYKNAQFEISRRLVSQHMALAFHVFSEFSAYFNKLDADYKRNMVSGMLPWMQTIHLQLLEQNGGPSAESHMLLVNLFEITVKSGPTLHNEIQALWQALATGPHPTNVQIVLDFVIDICLQKREQYFVNYAKQVVVFLSKTPAGSRVIEYLLLRISTKEMAIFRPTMLRKPPPDTSGLPYHADISEVLPTGVKQTSMSMSQVCMILLVDLVVAPVQFPLERLPTLLHVILVQWDQYIDIVQENARELLVHLIHELVISTLAIQSPELDKKYIEDFIELIRRNDPKIAWSYTDQHIPSGDDQGRAVAESMFFVVDEVVRIFTTTYPGIREELGNIATTWASSCPVRHVACRSFQVYRCLSVSITHQVLADMLARLSNTIADHETEGIHVFSIQILTTIRFVMADLTQLPSETMLQIFWTVCACLDTIFESEFQEVMGIMSQLLIRVNLAREAELDQLTKHQPPDWEGDFEGIHPLLYKGMRSSQSMNFALKLMDRLIKLPSSDIVGHDQRLLFTTLANLPRLLHSLDNHGRDSNAASARALAVMAERLNVTSLARVLEGYVNGRYKNTKEFLSQCLAAVRKTYFPTHDFEILVFLLGMVNNECSWFKTKVMQILCVLLPEMDLHRQEIAEHGQDLISPLLRLLTTEYCQQALDVLDNMVEMTDVPINNQEFAMTSSRTTESPLSTAGDQNLLYGTPSESGWSIPMPAKHAAATRNNVHMVFSAMAYGLPSDVTPTLTPSLEFYRDDESSMTYFTDRTATMMSDDFRDDAALGELAEKLDTLDDFFDDGTPSPGSESPIDYTLRRSNTDDSIYGHGTLPSLHHSLQTESSGVSSFHSGMAGDYRHNGQSTPHQTQLYPVPHFLQISPEGTSSSHASFSQRMMSQSMQPFPLMSSAPFSTHATEPLPPLVDSRIYEKSNGDEFGSSSGLVINRPGLHNRSITSPALSNRVRRGPASAREPPTHLAHDFFGRTDDDTDHLSGSFSDDDMPVNGKLGLASQSRIPHYSGTGTANDNSGVGYRTNTYTTRHRGSANGSSSNGVSGRSVGSATTAGFKAGIRSGIRRLTSTGTQREAREALHTSLMKSPQVPKLPSSYNGAGGGGGSGSSIDVGAISRGSPTAGGGVKNNSISTGPGPTSAPSGMGVN